MINCQSCGNQNAIGTRYCRSCGTKLEVKQEQLFAAVQEDIAVAKAKRWLEHGRSALLLGLFFLTCGMVLRYAVVPPMPAADVQRFEVGSPIPEQLPMIPMPKVVVKPSATKAADGAKPSATKAADGTKPK